MKKESKNGKNRYWAKHRWEKFVRAECVGGKSWRGYMDARISIMGRRTMIRRAQWDRTLQALDLVFRGAVLTAGFFRGVAG